MFTVFVDMVALAQHCWLPALTNCFSLHTRFSTEFSHPNALERNPPHLPLLCQQATACASTLKIWQNSEWKCGHSKMQRDSEVVTEHSGASVPWTGVHFWLQSLEHLVLVKKCQMENSSSSCWWLEEEMLLGNWKPDLTVGACRMGTCAGISVCEWAVSNCNPGMRQRGTITEAGSRLQPLWKDIFWLKTSSKKTNTVFEP